MAPRDLHLAEVERLPRDRTVPEADHEATVVDQRRDGERTLERRAPCAGLAQLRGERTAGEIELGRAPHRGLERVFIDQRRPAARLGHPPQGGVGREYPHEHDVAQLRVARALRERERLAKDVDRLRAPAVVEVRAAEAGGDPRRIGESPRVGVRGDCTPVERGDALDVLQADSRVGGPFQGVRRVGTAAAEATRGPFVPDDRLVVRVEPSRRLGGGRAVRRGTLEPTRFPEAVREQLDVLRELGAFQDDLCDQLVQPPRFRRQQLAVDRVARQRVTKLIDVLLVRDGVDQLQLAQPAQRRRRLGAIDAEHGAQQIEPEAATEHRRLREQLTLVRLATIEAFVDHRAERDRQRRRRGARRAQPVDRVTHQLFGEQRVAARLSADLFDEAARYVDAALDDEAGEELRQLEAVERLERDRRHRPFPSESPERGEDRIGRPDLVVAIRPDQQQPLARRPLREDRQQVEELGLRPVQIFEDDRSRAPAGHALEGGGDRLEQLRLRRPGPGAAQGLATELFERAIDRVQRALRERAAARGRECVRRAGGAAAAILLHEARLADAGIPGDEDQPAPTLGCVAAARQYVVELGDSTDERPCENALGDHQPAERFESAARPAWSGGVRSRPKSGGSPYFRAATRGR